MWACMGERSSILNSGFLWSGKSLKRDFMQGQEICSAYVEFCIENCNHSRFTTAKWIDVIKEKFRGHICEKKKPLAF